MDRALVNTRNRLSLWGVPPITLPKAQGPNQIEWVRGDIPDGCPEKEIEEAMLDHSP